MELRNAFALVIFLTSCMPISEAKVRCHQIDVDVDNLFNKDERTKIIKALSNWEKVSDKICFTVEWKDTTDDEPTFRSDGKASIYSPKRAWQIKAALRAAHRICPTRKDCLGVTVWEHDGQTSDIFIFTENLQLLRATVEHEVGHLLGLHHTTVYDSIMFPRIRADKSIGTIDKKNLNCLIETQTLMTQENDCVYVK